MQIINISAKSGALRTKMLGPVKKRLDYLVYRYNLETHLYMCEPWERKLVSKCAELFVVIKFRGLIRVVFKYLLADTVFLTMLFLVLFVSYLYVPSMLERIKSVVSLPPSWLKITSLKMQSDDL